MKAKYLTFIATAIAVTVANSTTVVAESGNGKPAEIKLTPPAMKILCDEFPANSRCSGGAKASTSTDSTTTPSSGTNPPSSSSPTGPGTTSPIQGTPPGAGSQTRPYVTPQ